MCTFRREMVWVGVCAPENVWLKSCALHLCGVGGLLEHAGLPQVCFTVPLCVVFFFWQ